MWTVRNSLLLSPCPGQVPWSPVTRIKFISFASNLLLAVARCAVLNLRFYRWRNALPVTPRSPLFSLVSAVSRPTFVSIVSVPLRAFFRLESTHEQGHLFVWFFARLSFLAGVMSAVAVH